MEKVKLPRTVIAARCPWKYQDTDQGGCDWPNDNEFTINGTAYILYFDETILNNFRYYGFIIY